jgi:hypothetical protein
MTPYSIAKYPIAKQPGSEALVQVDTFAQAMILVLLLAVLTVFIQPLCTCLTWVFSAFTGVLIHSTLEKICVALHIAISIAYAYAVMSLNEYVVHRFPMHSPKLAKSFNSQRLWEAYKNHSTKHHNEFYAFFKWEPDPQGRLINLGVGVRNTIIVVGPSLALIALLDQVTALVLLVLAIIHNVLWTATHTAMHTNVNNFWTRTPAFRYLQWYHFLHHRQQARNFNALMPMWDAILGTKAMERESDRQAMQTELWKVRSPRF